MKTYHAIEVRAFPAEGNKGPRIRLTSLYFQQCRRWIDHDPRYLTADAARRWLETYKTIEIIGMCDTPRGALLISPTFERFAP